MQDSLSSIVDDAIRLRRELHADPEVAWEEVRTAARIRAELDGLGIAWRACAGTGCVATLAAGATGPTIALRADMDGLPITETSGRAWASKNPGLMHACGHDGHTATLLAVARVLASRESELQGPVRLIFQPAEEGGHGARRMIEEGALEGVDRIFGWHNWPAIPEGQAVCPDGTVMSANGAFTIDVIGVGGHSSQPELCRDPVLAGSAINLALQQIVSRRSRPQAPCVVSVTSFLAESGVTTIPDRARLAGSVRASTDAQRTGIERAIREISEATAASYGVSAEVTIHPRYGATVNHPGPAREMRAALHRVFGAEYQADVPVPIMASEDFSYYLREIPGAFALVGAGGEDHAVPCHNAAYDFNDALIEPMARVYLTLVGLEIAR